MAGIIIGSPGFRKLGKATAKAVVKAAKKNPAAAAGVAVAITCVAIATQVDFAKVADKLERKLEEAEAEDRDDAAA